MLIHNGQWDIVAKNVNQVGLPIRELLYKPRYEHILPIVEKQKLAILTQVHHDFILTFSNIMPENTLQNLTKIKFDFEHCDMSSLHNYFDEKYLLKHVKRGLQMFDVWMSNANGYVPLLITSLSNKLDLYKNKDFCLTTMSIRSLLNFYADSYEYLCQILGVCVAANNILNRHDINAFPAGSQNVNLNKFLEMRNTGKKLEDVRLNETFTLPLQNLNNKIRNAIDHMDYNIDYNKQIIDFNDNNTSLSFTFIEMQEMCLRNLESMLYAMEHLYCFLRMYYMQEFYENVKLNLIDKKD